MGRRCVDDGRSREPARSSFALIKAFSAATSCSAACSAAAPGFESERLSWSGAERWHGRQETTRLPDGRVELTVPDSEVDDVLGEIPQARPDMEVVEPPELVDLVKERLRRAAEVYG